MVEVSDGYICARPSTQNAVTIGPAVVGDAEFERPCVNDMRFGRTFGCHVPGFSSRHTRSKPGTSNSRVRRHASYRFVDWLANVKKYSRPRSSSVLFWSTPSSCWPGANTGFRAVMPEM